MELISLEIKNIASIESAFIDFSAAPLKDEPIFLICGETGAGKSTILDAVCLALYNDAPRLSSVQQDRLIDDAVAPGNRTEDDTLGTRDTRQFLRKGSGEGSVTLIFCGSDGVEYTSYWHVRRSRLRPDGRLQDLERTLSWGDGNCLSSRKDVDEKIRQVTGMNFNQYCRTSMLAQGEFSKFLKSSDTEKADILEKLTRTDIYSRLGARIFQRTNELKAGCRRMQDKISSITLMSEEDKEKARQRISGLNAEAAEVLSASKGTAAKLQSIRRYSELAGKVAEAKKSVHEAESVLSSEAFKADVSLCSEWDSTAQLRAQEGQVHQLEQDLRQKNSEVEGKLSVFLSLCKETDAARRELDALEARGRELSEDMARMSAHQRLFEESTSVADWLETVFRSEEERKKLSAKLEDGAVLQKKFGEDIKAAQERLDAMGLRKKTLQADLSEKRTKIAEADKAGKSRLRDVLSDRVRKLTEVQHSLESLRRLETERKRCAETLAGYETRLKAAVQAASDRDSAFSAADLAYAGARDLAERMKDSVGNWARMARMKLHVGDICPLCGQEVHKLLTDKDFEQMLGPVLDDLQSREKVRKEAEIARNDAHSEVTALTNNLSDASKALDEAAKGYAAALETAEARCKETGIAQDDKDLTDRLSEEIARTDKDMQALKQSLDEIAAMENAAAELQKSSDSLQKDIETCTSRLAALNLKMSDVRSSLSAMQSTMQSLESKAADALDKASGYMPSGNWLQIFRSSPEKFISRLKTGAERYRKEKEESRTVADTLSRYSSIMDSISRSRSSVLASFPTWEESRLIADQDNKWPDADAAPAWDSLQDRWISLSAWTSSARETLDRTSGRITSMRQDLSEALSGIGMNEGRLEELSRHPSEAIAQKKTDIARRQTALSEARAALSQREADLARHTEEIVSSGLSESVKPENIASSVKDLEDETVRLDAKANELNRAVGAIMQQLAKDQEDAALTEKVRAEAESLKTEYEKWERLSQIFGDATGNRFKKIAQGFVLAELIRSANGYLSHLSDRYVLDNQSGSLAITVRDMSQGGAERSVNTLSGGETFLVSLSMALGLSSLSRNALNVGTIFIDEGFGTLSSDYLNVVMTALENLHQMGGKKVGIISHVEALRDRIPTQIQVTRRGPSASTVNIVSGL